MISPDIFIGQEEVYADFANSSYTWRYIERPALMECLMPLMHNDRVVLDVGCGIGRSTQLLLDAGANPKNTYGIDMNVSLLEKACAACPDVNFSMQDLASLQFPDNMFHIAMASMVFQVQDNEIFSQSLRHLYRVLKPEGTLIYVVTHPLHMVDESIDQYMHTGWLTVKTPWHTSLQNFHRTTETYITETIQAGFAVTSVDIPSVIEAGRVDTNNYLKYSKQPKRLLVTGKKLT